MGTWCRGGGGRRGTPYHRDSNTSRGGARWSAGDSQRGVGGEWGARGRGRRGAERTGERRVGAGAHLVGTRGVQALAQEHGVRDHVVVEGLVDALREERLDVAVVLGVRHHGEDGGSRTRLEIAAAATAGVRRGGRRAGPWGSGSARATARVRARAQSMRSSNRGGVDAARVRVWRLGIRAPARPAGAIFKFSELSPKPWFVRPRLFCAAPLSSGNFRASTRWTKRAGRGAHLRRVFARHATQDPTRGRARERHPWLLPAAR